MTNFQNTDYIFISENPHLSESAFKFLVGRNLLRQDEVPAVLTDRYFAGLLLVLFGGKAEDITRYRLLANCAAALEARNDVVRKMHRFLAEMDTNQADRFRALMTVERAGQHLMQLTLGDSFLVTNDNVPKILEQVEKVLVEKEREYFEKQLSAIEQRHRSDMRQLTETHETELREVSESRRAMEQTLRDAEAQALQAVSQSREAQSDVARLEGQLRRERLASLESKRRQIQRAMVMARKVQSYAHDGIAVALGLLSSGLTYIGATHAGTGWALLIAIGAGVLLTLCFWKMPEKFFGDLLEKVRNFAFEYQLRMRGLYDDLQQFEIDWEKVAAKTRDAET